MREHVAAMSLKRSLKVGHFGGDLPVLGSLSLERVISCIKGSYTSPLKDFAAKCFESVIGVGKDRDLTANKGNSVHKKPLSPHHTTKDRITATAPVPTPYYKICHLWPILFGLSIAR
jgi:hypothetical protein